jgi:transcriptional regulator with XRE-family HTH domain
MAKVRHAYPKTVSYAAELLGAEIRDARLQRRWSVRELAERAGVSTGTLQRVEHSARRRRRRVSRVEASQ